MKYPLILPPQLDSIRALATENELFSNLTESLSRAILFLSYAIDDTDWCQAHVSFIQRIFRWLTGLYDKGILGVEAIQEIRKVVHQNPSNVAEPLWRDIELKINDKHYQTSSILLASVSPYFNNILRKESVRKSRSLEIQVEDAEVAELLIEIAEAGPKELWRQKAPKLYALLKQAKLWEMDEVQKDVEDILTRYVEPSDALPKLKEALKNGWFEIAAKACEIYNKEPIGLKLSLGEGKRLKAEFLNLKLLTTLEALKSVGDLVEIIRFNEDLGNDPDSVKAVEGVRRLWGIDLSETTAPFTYYEGAPTTIKYLNLNRAQWLNEQWIERLLDHFNELTHLKLSDQSRMSLSGFAAIARMKALQSLSIAGQKGLTDEYVSMLTVKELRLEELDLSGCQGLTPFAIQRVLGNAPRLRVLVLDNTSADDRVLSEISIRLSQLEVLGLENTQVTEKGIQSLKRQKPHLIVS